MIKKTAAIFLICIFLAHVTPADVGARHAVPLQLEPLIKEAQENNPDILAAGKRWDAALIRVPQAKSLDSPNVGIKFEKIPKGTFKFNKVMPDDRMLSFEQMLPLFGKLSLRGKVALAEAQMYAADYKNKELDVINQVKNAYYGLFMSDKEIELSESSMALLQGIAGIAEDRYVVGDISQEEIFKIDLELARLTSAISNLKQERNAKETRLNSLLNRDPEGHFEGLALEELAGFNQDIKDLYRYTMENNQELLIFSYAIEKNRHVKSLAQRGLFPDMLAGIVQRGITSGGLGPWDLMLSFTMPFWFWTKQRYEIKEAVSGIEEAEAVYKAMKNKALAETKGLYVRIEISKNRINLLKNNEIPLLEGAIQSSLSGYASGKGDIMLLLDNQRMLIQTKMDYYKALVEYNMNLAGLETVCGGINLTEVKNES